MKQLILIALLCLSIQAHAGVLGGALQGLGSGMSGWAMLNSQRQATERAIARETWEDFKNFCIYRVRVKDEREFNACMKKLYSGLN